MLSVIIPVYNTGKYLRQCLDSVVNQDYKDIEIICINDGSTDDSLDILNEYCSKDSRIRVIDKAHEGQGVARSIAIEQAKGDFICCIDSDDWITDGCLSKLVERQRLTNSDIVIGNSSRTILDSEEIRINYCEKATGVLEGIDINESVFEITGTVWPKLIKKSLFTENNIVFPKIYYEDLAVMPLIYALSERIAFIDDFIYVQRMNSSSTVHRVENIYDRIGFTEYLVEGFKSKNLYDQYEELIKEYLVKRAQINIRMVKSICNKIYMDFTTQQKAIWKEKYGLNEMINKNSFCFGSYNLMILTKIFMQLEDSATVPEYYGGSSLISCMSDANNELNKLNVSHKNVFRRKMLINEFERRFLRMNPANLSDYDCFFIDFLEERYDIGKYHDEYFTISQALSDIKESLSLEYEVIKAFSNTWWSLWEDSCEKFVDRLKVLAEGKKIVLVKMYLSEKIVDGDKEELFDDIDTIRQTNFELEKCYLHFLEKCPEAIAIDIRDDDIFRTDRNFRHGCYPWHLSDSAYGGFSKKIEIILNERNQENNKLQL